MRRTPASGSASPAAVLAAKPRSRFRLWQLVVLATAIAGVVVIYWRSSALDRDRQEALEAAKNGDFARAEPLLRRVRESRQNDIQVIQALALGLEQADRTEEAEVEFNRWSELSPDDPEPIAASFRMWVRLRFFEKAANVAERLLQYRSIDPPLYPHIVAIFMIAGRVQQASETARAGLAVSPGDPRLRCQLAEALQAQDKTKEAAEILRNLTFEAPSFFDGWKLRGIVLAESDDPAGAITCFERALALQPADLSARYALILALRRCGRDDESQRELVRFEKTRAARDLANFSSNHPEQLDLAIRTAQAFFEVGLDPDGHEFIRRVLERDPNHPEALRLKDAHRATQAR